MIKRILQSILKTIGGLVILAILLLWYTGFFNMIYIAETESGPFYGIYTETGLYDDPAEERNILFSELFKRDIITHKAFAYTEKPFQNNLITQTGWIIEGPDLETAEEIIPPYKMVTIERKPRIVVDFSYDNSFSIMSGSYLVYRRLKLYCKQNGYIPGDIYEIYDDEQGRIFYHLNYEPAE